MTLSIPWRRAGALGGCAALLAAGALVATPGQSAPAQAAPRHATPAEATSAPAEAQAELVTVTPNPWYAGDPFEGWGTSLVWMANATGDYPDYLREKLYQKVFGEDGLNLNIARYNVGGENASDVQDYLRPGGAVEGYWAEDTTGDLYGAETTYENRDEILQAWDPDNPAHYDFTADATQRWWVEQLVEDDQITHWEVFANSAPYFMTESGYVSGGFDGGDEQLRTDAMEKFAGYLAEVTDFLEREYGMEVDTIDPFNEPNTDYWSTQLENGEPVGGRQEGMHVGPERQVQMLAAMDERLAMDSTSTGAVISAMDETNPGTFATNWNGYTPAAKDAVGQLNVHTYGTGGRRVARDLAKSADVPLWMSEVGGSWTDEFNLTSMDNAMGIAARIQNDLSELEPNAWVLWQPIEDLYNMGPRGEDLSWGSMFVDFDCVQVQPGVWKSQRRIDDAGGDAGQVPECGVKVNAKFGALQNFTQFIRPGDSLVPTDSPLATAAVDADGEGLTLVYRNPSEDPRQIDLDLSLFAQVGAGATVQTYTTTKSTTEDPTANAIVPGQAGTVSGSTASVDVPARSITTIQIDGVAGVAEDAAPVQDGQTYQIMGAQSGKALTTDDAEGPTIESAATTAGAVEQQLWTVHRADSGDRGDVRPYVLTETHGHVLGATENGTDLREMSVEEAAQNPQTRWMVTTEDGTHWSLVNDGLSQALDVQDQSTQDGAEVELWESSGAANQSWTFRETTSTGTAPIEVSTLAGVAPVLPEMVVPAYEWGQGAPVPVTWDVPDDGVWQDRGEVTVTGSATDVYGNELSPGAVVVVGGYSVTDPVSMTVAAGVGPDSVIADAPTTIPVHIGASQIDFETTVDWDFSDIGEADLAGTGVLTVSGTAESNQAGESLPAILSLLVTEPAGFNLARQDSTQVSATFTEPGYSPGETRNGIRTDKAWSTWKSGEKNASDTLTYEFGQPEVLDAASIYFYDDGHRSWASPIVLEYRDGEGQWRTAPGYEEPKPVQEPGDGSAPVVEADLSEVGTATGLRVAMTAYPESYLTVAEVEITALGPSPAPVAQLAALRLDGAGVDGFAAGTDTYNEAVEGSHIPQVTAVPVDSAATVNVQQPTAEDPVATVQVTSADGQVQRTYTVKLDRHVALSDVQVFGDVTAGQTVRAIVAVDPAGADLDYQWYLDDEEIRASPRQVLSTASLANAVSAPVELPPDADGAQLRVEVTATAQGFEQAQLGSDPVTVAGTSEQTPPETDPPGSAPPEAPGDPEGSGDPSDSGDPSGTGGPAGDGDSGGAADDFAPDGQGDQENPAGQAGDLPSTGTTGAGWALLAAAALLAAGAGLRHRALPTK